MLKSITTLDHQKLSIEYQNNEVNTVPFLKDFRLGIPDPSEDIVENILKRPREYDLDSSYFINFSGGLGDCMMILEILIAFNNFLSKRMKRYEFLCLTNHERLTFYKPIFDIINLPIKFIIRDEINENELLEISDYKLVFLPSPLKSSRVEHLSIGNFRDYLWAIWGIPGHYSSFTDQKIADIIFNKLNDGYNDAKKNKKKAIIIFSKGFGKANRWKTWPENNWILFLEKFQKTNDEEIIFIDSSEDLHNIIKTRTDLNSKIKFITHEKDENITHMARLFSNSKLIISIDTGPAHVAGFFAQKCIVLWGPTNPIFYQNKNNINLRLSSCPPCFYSQRTEICNDNICMKSISPEHLTNACNYLINKGAP
jgi:hypothetical protein